MRIGTPKELFEGEARVAMTPDSAVQLQKLGYDCVIETGAGAAARFSDADYKAVGVEVVKTAAALYKAADIVAKVRPPEDVEIKRLQKGQTLISFFYDCDGHGSTYFTGSENGCAVIHGQYRGLSLCD